MTEENQKKNGTIEKFLTIVEKTGNALPHPATLFALFAILVVFLSWVFSLMDITVQHPGTGESIQPINLMSETG
ncbi:MAG: AbgT family transporter, partial [Cytophagales bacterium]